VKKRRLTVLAAAVLVGVGTASYAIAGHDDGPGHVPNTKNFRATLLGYEETPANSTTGFGRFEAKLDDRTNTIHYTFSYSNLEGQTVPGGKILFAHVHFGQKGVAGGVSYFLCDNSAVPVAQACPDDGTGSGTVSGDITAANVIGPNGQGIEPGSFAEIVRAMQAGVAYANIHTTRWPGGEIRGQINENRDD
jgi:CHRD domain